MKKIVMILLLLLGIGCAGGGYYIFYWKPQHEPQETPEKTELVPKPVEQPIEIREIKEAPITDYYVNVAKLGIREHPSYDAFVESLAYKGDKLHILEQKDGWGRISVYYVYEEGGEEVAEWVPMDQLLEVPPTITKEERIETISSYIESSDDFKQHFESFIWKTEELLRDKTCTPEDFEETKGWMRSVTFSERDVYFVYCGGLKQANKIYLDVQTGETFYR
ncbi:hypothetical protein [Vibrio japonicus]|uniref:SH3 domain-containing protein n=1 Tax=Vibrio japonicus TaxID=1824638 RepID=A0ABY5LLK0_9VIBR|nr:hypothetical protein [Vibrio japonicus]UUM32746.1 hypothetical protein NP165_14365 [Vibrio japonicus]